MSTYNFSVLGVDGVSVDLSKYKGCVTLIVNTSCMDEKAAQCYDFLASVYQKYKEEDLTILLFPCSQFGRVTSAVAEKEFLETHRLQPGTLFKEVDVRAT